MVAISVDDGRRVKLTAGVMAACVLLVASVILAWVVSTPWYRPFWWPLALVASAWVSFALGTDRRLRGPWRALGFGALAVLSVAVMWLAGSGAIGRAKFDAARPDLEVAATAIAASAPVPSTECLPPPEDTYRWLGRPDRVCVHTYDNPMRGGVRDVELWWGDHGLVYTAGAEGFPRGTCVDQITERWKARAEMSGLMECPAGFTHVPHV